MKRARLGAVLITAIVVAAALALIVPCALAADVSPARVSGLARKAIAGDPVALAQLRSVTSVGGAPADLNSAIGSGSAQQLRARLLVLADAVSTARPSATSAGRARRSAGLILAGRRFQGSLVTDPFQRGLQKLSRWIGNLAASAPGGPPVFWLVVGVIVLVLAAVGARRIMRRLEPTDHARAMLSGDTREDPAALERDADAAETEGAFADSVRLRFRAGLLRLSSIDYRASLLTGDVARRLRSPQFEALAASFDRIAYGGASAGPADAEAAREGWERVLAEPQRR
jgi:hypothetical protein